ncbi:MFS transporter [Streptomyces indicus]|uniref:MFS transporter, DHA2 family, methylenomycin A resistance protein n=1 Tax=Streptomyces indicus TaxID=417292 RepID=A0A1G9FEU8_9ACTN|nr:MFS transporter [Streptomyces indicus]SDK86884.1 MFS transporter, DHA2 family, methylenomycin A resistance protein [Streptomyces indicus]
MPLETALRTRAGRPGADRPARPHSPALTLLAALLGFFLITLDVSVVNVALPSMADSLGAGMTGLQWVVDAYTLALAALMLSTGAFADRIGATKAYGIGVALFTAASVACGLAPDLATLAGARVVQGVGAAIVLPASLALVRRAFPDAARRARAVAAWAAGGSAATAFGPVAGGALTTAWDWRGIFFINVPFGLLALALLVRAPVFERRRTPLDLPGQVSAAVALTALTFAVIERGTAGAVAAGVAVAAAAVFVRVERRQEHPLVPFGLFRNRTVAVMVATGAAVSVAFYGIVFVFSLFFQQVQGRSALAAGLLFLPMTGLIAVSNIVAGKLSGRYGPHLPMLIGQPLAVAGLLLLLLVDAQDSALTLALILMPLAVGSALTVPPLTAAILDAVPAERAGLAAGVLNSARQVAGALSVAGFGVLISGALGTDAFVTGLHASVLIAAVFMTATATATALLPRRGR